MDQLRLAVGGEGGAQGVVAVHDGLQGGAHGVHVQGAAQPGRARLHVRQPGFVAHLRLDPQLPLPLRERDDLRRAGGHLRRAIRPINGTRIRRCRIDGIRRGRIHIGRIRIGGYHARRSRIDRSLARRRGKDGEGRGGRDVGRGLRLQARGRGDEPAAPHALGRRAHAAVDGLDVVVRVGHGHEVGARLQGGVDALQDQVVVEQLRELDLRAVEKAPHGAIVHGRDGVAPGLEECVQPRHQGVRARVEG
ncbi:MAG TPA: hypothetical protein VF142_01865, partial [Longimicrobium sp.]